MPRTNIYDDRKIRYVEVIHPQAATSNWFYFFRTPVPLTEVAALGQTEVSTLPDTLGGPSIIGTRTPRPIRMRNQNTGISSFCSSTSYATAIAANWRRTKNYKFMAPRSQTVAPASYTDNSKGAVIAAVSTASFGGEMKFGWYMPVQQLRRIGNDIAGLGIEFPTTEEDWRNVVMGSDTPRPPRATKVNIDNATGRSDHISTFYLNGTNLPAGWVHSEDAVLFSI